jgi:hypothetical protein
LRILVALPSISFSSAKNDGVIADHFDDVVRFKFAGDTLDVFANELRDVAPSNLLCINVPHWQLGTKNCVGVAGPGPGNDELFFPASMRSLLAPVAGTYDKWRPYPANPPLSTYATKMARRFAKKRCRMLQRAVSKVSCKAVFYVEHSPMSIAHLDEVQSVMVSNDVFEASVAVWRDIPGADLVIFSPYGVGKRDGFVVSNRLDPNSLSEWEGIRKYLKGDFDADTGRGSWD